MSDIGAVGGVGGQGREGEEQEEQEQEEQEQEEQEQEPQEEEAETFARLQTLIQDEDEDEVMAEFSQLVGRLSPEQMTRPNAILTYCSVLTFVAENGRSRLISAVLRSGKSLDWTRVDGLKLTPLMRAARCGHLGVLRVLLAQVPQDVDATNE